MYVRMDAYTVVYTRVRSYVRKHNRTYACTFAYTYTHVHSYVYIRSHIRMYNRTYRCTFTYTYTSVRTPYSRHVAVCTNPLTARTDSRWIFMIRNDRQNTSLQYASCNVPQAHAMNNTSCCDLCRKVVLVVMNCSDSSFVWLPVISKQNLIRCSSQLRLLDSSLN